MKFCTKIMLAVAALLAAVGLPSNLSAAPLPAPLDSLGPNFLTLNATTSLAYNSNVLSAPGGPNKFDDMVFSFDPGVMLDYGKADQFGEGNLSYNENFLRYDRHPSLNEELSNLALGYTRVQSRFTFTLTGSYVQAYQNTPSAVGGPSLTSIIRTDTLNGGADVHWNMSDKFNFDAALDYSQNTYLYAEGQNFNNSDTYTIPATAYWVYSDKLSFGAGYTYQQTDAQASAAAPGSAAVHQSNEVSLNAQLNEWEKLTGSASVGVTENNVTATTGPTGNPSITSTTGSYALNLAYTYSDKVHFTLAGNRGFSTGTQGQNIESTNVGLGVNYAYTSTINVQANLLNYTYSQYLQTTRDDNTYSSGITANWLAYNWLTLSAGYTYFMNSSSLAGATYNINVVTISATVKY